VEPLERPQDCGATVCSSSLPIKNDQDMYRAMYRYGEPCTMSLRTAKVFMTGRSQAVRLPADFRFSTDEVYVRRDEATGDVILSPRPTLEQIFAAIDALGVAKDWKFERDLAPQPERNLFGDD
jgi:antitoxin VapB